MNTCIPAHTHTYTDTYTIIEGLKAGFESCHIEGLKAVLYSLKVGFHIFAQKSRENIPKITQKSRKITQKLHKNPAIIFIKNKNAINHDNYRNK